MATRERPTSSFVATTEDGRRHTLLIFAGPIDNETTGGPGGIPATGRIETEDGLTVNRVRKGEYMTVRGTRLTSDDPAAP